MRRNKSLIAKAGQQVQAVEHEEWEGEPGSVIHAGYRSTVNSNGSVICGEGSMVFGKGQLSCLSGSTVYAESGSRFEAFAGSKVFAEVGSIGTAHPGCTVINRGGKVKFL